MDCSYDISSSGKKKEEKGGLIYTIAVDPLDFIDLVHDGCDNGFELFKISTRRQLLEDTGEVEARLRKSIFTNTFSKTLAQMARDLSANFFGILSRSCWRAVAMPLKNKVSLALGWRFSSVEYPKPAKSSCSSSSWIIAAMLTRPSDQSSTVALKVF